MINIKSTENSIKLLTKDKFCNDDINVTFDGGVQIVDELPTNPKENVIYEEKEYSDIDVFLRARGSKYSTYEDMSLEMIIKRELNPNANVFYYVVDELPTTPLESDFGTYSNFYVYIYNDIAYVYGNVGYGNMWLPVSQVWASMGATGSAYIDKGFVKSHLYADTPTRMLDAYLYVTYKKRVGIKNEYNAETIDGDWNDYFKIFDKTIKTFSNSELNAIPENSFRNCIYLTKVDCQNVTLADEMAFCGCESLKEVNLPNLVYLANNALCGTGLEIISLPKLVYVGESTFAENYNLKEVYLPKIEILEYGCFQYCGSLESIHLYHTLNINNYCFMSCIKLKDIYSSLEYTDGTISLGNVDVFQGAGTEQGYINLHVRPELVEAYETATNWSSLIAEGKIKIIGDYTDD